jgi:hypothetical protein
MTTTQLHDYLITCDRRYPDAGCRRDVFLQAATDQTNAEERARALGWVVGLLPGRPSMPELQGYPLHPFRLREVM